MQLADIKSIPPDDLFDIIKNSNLRSDIIDHSRRVCDICKIIAHELLNEGVNLNCKMLYKAAYLHDIGKVECSGDAHPFMSAVRLYTLFECDNHRKYARKLSYIIVSHKGYFSPHLNIAMEAAVLRMADKIDKYNKTSSQKAKKAYNMSFKKIERFFKENGLEYYPEFAEACKQARKKVKYKTERTKP